MRSRLRYFGSLPVALLVTFGFAASRALPAQAHPYPDPSRDVVGWFYGNIIGLPSGMPQGTVEEASILSPAIADLFEGYSVESLARTYPDAKPADTLAVSRTGELVRVPDYTQVFYLRLPVGADLDAFSAAMSAQPGVLFVEKIPVPDFAAAVPLDPMFENGSQWGLHNIGQGQGTADADIDAPEAWSVPVGSVPTVAVIDNGFEATHPEFQGRVSPGSDLGYCATGRWPGHGYQVAGVLGANANNHQGIAGVLWTGQMLSELIQDPNDEQCGIGEGDIAAAVSHATNYAAVLNHSYTMEDPKSQGAPLNSWLVGEKIAAAYRRNLVSVAAVGNTMDGTVWYPAGYKQGVIAVGAITRTNERWVHFPEGSNTGPHVDLAAPGAGIQTCYPPNGYTAASGTSLAAPLVSGAAALLLARYSTLENDDVENILKLTADDISPDGRDDETGYGRLNLRRALTALDPPSVFASGVAPGTSRVIDHGHGFQFYGLGIPNWPPPGGCVPFPTGGCDMSLLEVQQDVTFQVQFSSVPDVWGRGRISSGLSPYGSPNYGVGFCDVVSDQRQLKLPSGDN